MLLLFSMSLMGSISVLLFLILELINPYLLSILSKRVYLIISASMFLIPYHFFLIPYKAFLESCLRKYNLIVDYKTTKQEISQYIIQVTPHGIYNRDLIICFYLSIGSIIFFLYFLHSINQYKKCKIYFTRTNFIKYIPCKKKQIPLYECPGISTPFVIGIRHPALIIPNEKIDSKDLNLIIEHEMTHIKHYDNHWKFIFVLLIILHFYNPFTYILFSLWNEYTEVYCDAIVTREKSSSDVVNYINLIIDTSTSNKSKSSLWPLAAFNINTNHIKKRIEMIKNKHITNPIISILIILFFCTLSSFSVLAYTPKSVFYTEEYCDTIWLEDSSIILNNTNNYLHDISEKQLLVEYSNGKKLYINQSEDEIDTNSICIHKYEPCTASSHTMNSSGGCTIITYNVRVCNKCHSTVVDEEISRLTSKKCPHK